MVEQLDAHELKILSDVLALVVDEHPGASASALEFLRRRARSSKVTGGALKDLLVKTQAMLAPGAGSAHEARPGPADETIGRLNATVEDLRQQLRQAWRRLDNVAAENLRYQHLLAAAKEEMLEFQQAKGQVRLKRRVAGGVLVVLLAIGGGIGWSLGSAHLGASPTIASSQRNILPSVASRQAVDPVASAKLTVEDTAAIVGHFKECLKQLGRVPFEASVMVMADEDGVVREAEVVDDSAHRFTDPALQQMAERLSSTILSPACAKLPLGHTEQRRKLAFRLLIRP